MAGSFNMPRAIVWYSFNIHHAAWTNVRQEGQELPAFHQHPSGTLCSTSGRHHSGAPCPLPASPALWAEAFCGAPTRDRCPRSFLKARQDFSNTTRRRVNVTNRTSACAACAPRCPALTNAYLTFTDSAKVNTAPVLPPYHCRDSISVSSRHLSWLHYYNMATALATSRGRHMT